MTTSRRSATRRRGGKGAATTSARAASQPKGDPRDELPEPDGPSPEEIEPLDPAEGVAAFRAALKAGDDWYGAMLRVVARWTAPEEDVDGVAYRYLIAGEAFDWLRLAERLIDAAGAAVPAEEAERLLFDGVPPPGADPAEEAFARAVGHQKYRAHLNFQYGVTVEEALLLQAELELQKARTLEGPRGAPPDVAAYERVYGRTLEQLAAEYRAETGANLARRVGQAELHAFTYWCSKYRFRLAEPARVASDTRKALALLSRLEAERAPRERRVPGATRPVIDLDG